MAEAFAKHLGQGKVEAWSAGSRPAGFIHPRTFEFMRERGLDLSGQRSKGLDELPQGIVWDWIVTMGCGDACPNLPARRRLDWDLQDPVGLSDAEFRRVRDRIEENVRRLLAELPREP
jgi:protein-tyrosine-phosphatase